MRYNDETEIWWNDPMEPKNEPTYTRTNWSDSFVEWSPRGLYMATFHRLGCAAARWRRQGGGATEPGRSAAGWGAVAGSSGHLEELRGGPTPDYPRRDR